MQEHAASSSFYASGDGNSAMCSKRKNSDGCQRLNTY